MIYFKVWRVNTGKPIYPPTFSLIATFCYKRLQVFISPSKIKHKNQNKQKTNQYTVTPPASPSFFSCGDNYSEFGIFYHVPIVIDLLINISLNNIYNYFTHLKILYE